ncbi:MAG: CopG family ribbon-helix-helix protein [bacterium]
MAMTSVRMPDDLAERLEQLAARLERAKGWVINEALREYLERAELRQRMHEDTMEGIEALEAGETVDGDDVLTWLDSWGTPNELPPPE